MSNDGTHQTSDPGPAAPADAGAAPAGPATTTRQLVRDPYSRLGGVASGMSHHFGVDVSLVRLAFVLLTFTSGIGLIVYLLAWLVVPRAQYWPPVDGQTTIRSISGRELAIGLVVLGLLLALFVNGGGTARIVVPVLLMVGGIWLLRQPEDPNIVTPLGPDQADRWAPPAVGDLRPADGSIGSEANPFTEPGAAQPADTVVGAAPPPPTGGLAPGTPVPRRRRRWGKLVLALLILFVGIPLILIAVVGTLIVTNGVNIGSEFSATYRPTTIEELPSSIDHETGEITLDLTALDLDAFDRAGIDTPIPIDVDLSFGEIRLVVPDDLEFDLQAEAGVGEVQVFENEESGINPDVDLFSEDADLAIDLEIGAGKILVARG